MKAILVIFTLIATEICLSQSLQTSQSVPVDGPYVFYNRDSVSIKTIYNDGGKEIAGNVTIHKTGKKEARLNINFAGHPDWKFSTAFHTITIPPTMYIRPDRLFIVSDIEGEFAALRSLLVSNRVIDSNYRWVYGNGHLVIAGDLFDRGTDINACLWLLYALEEEAKKTNGYVHVLLGNHDIMQLSGDYRYTDMIYLKRAELLNVKLSGLYNKNTELGMWLHSKNIVEKIGDLLVLHAGISVNVLNTGSTAESINSICRPWYATHYDDLPENMVLYFGPDSPIWYRGYFTTPMATEEQVDATLNKFKVRRIIVGHTIVDTSIVIRNNTKVIGIDVDQHMGFHKALIIEGDNYYEADNRGNKRLLFKEK